MEKCNVDDDLISVSSNSSSTNDQDNDASTPDTPEDDVDVETLFSNIEVLTFFLLNNEFPLLTLSQLGFYYLNIVCFIFQFSVLGFVSSRSH